MRFCGNKSWQFGGYESKQFIAWLLPIVATAAVTYGAGWVTAAKDAGGWRALAAAVVVAAARAAYVWARDNTAERG